MKHGIFDSCLIALGASLIFSNPGLADASGIQVLPQAPGQSPAPSSAPRPNVLIWMLDDVGFAQLSSYGGLVETPNIDRVAARGLRYSNYHTAPICSASRAALLTGRNPHSVHVGGHSGAPRPFAGYDSLIPPEDGTIAANLKAAGYVTFALGKWDHLPLEEMTPSGPFVRWPTGQGFDRFYGFIGADTDNWEPVLTRDTTAVAVPDTPEYHLNSDLADEAISMIQSRHGQSQRSPFLLYFATGTAHAPHHAPADWIERYRGKFDMGWDKAREKVLRRQIALGLIPESARLAPRPEEMPAWDRLNADERRLYVRQMEVFAAAVSHADAEFGRILDALDASGELDNTIIIVTSDNGASAEGARSGTYNEALFFNGHYPDAAENLPFIDKWGGPETSPHYALGWAVAGNTPFRYFKQTTFEGGTRVPFVVSWPAGTAARGEVRGQFVSVNDVTPTILDLATVEPATVLNNVRQSPMEGLSFSYTLDDARAPDRKKAQYFELFGNKGLWAGNWSIVTSHRLDPWVMTQTHPINEPWELYDLSADPGQTRDLAAVYPERVEKMARLFEEQALRFQVNPIGNMGESGQLTASRLKAEFDGREGVWRYPGPVSKLAERMGPPVTAGPFTMSVKVTLSTGDETGPIFARGGQLGGMALILDQGVPGFIVRDLAGRETSVVAGSPLPAGESRLQLVFDRPQTRPLAPAPATIRILVDNLEVANETVTLALPAAYSVSETFDMGTDWGSPVSTVYRSGTRFPGQLADFTFDFAQKPQK